MKIKICGLSCIEDISYVNGMNIDYAGFIFAEKSIRKINIKQAHKMKTALSPAIKSVGVFQNEDINKIIKVAQEGIIDIIQLHGSEDNNYINVLKDITKLQIIKAFKPTEEIKDSIADYILFDSCFKDKFGGSGKTFDWKLIPDTKKRIFLAGGLNINNIEKAIKTVQPYCVDINSGVEINGKKDHKKIIEIVQKIRGIKA